MKGTTSILLVSLFIYTFAAPREESKLTSLQKSLIEDYYDRANDDGKQVKYEWWRDLHDEKRAPNRDIDASSNEKDQSEDKSHEKGKDIPKSHVSKKELHSLSKRSEHNQRVQRSERRRSEKSESSNSLDSSSSNDSRRSSDSGSSERPRPSRKHHSRERSRDHSKERSKEISEERSKKKWRDRKQWEEDFNSDDSSRESTKSRDTSDSDDSTENRSSFKEYRSRWKKRPRSSKESETHEDRSRESKEDRSRESKEDRSRERKEDRSRESKEDRSWESKEDRSKETKEDRSKESKEDRSRESKEDRSKETKEDRSKESKEDRSKETKEDRSKESKEDRSDSGPDHWRRYDQVLRESRQKNTEYKSAHAAEYYEAGRQHGNNNGHRHQHEDRGSRDDNSKDRNSRDGWVKYIKVIHEGYNSSGLNEAKHISIVKSESQNGGNSHVTIQIKKGFNQGEEHASHKSIVISQGHSYVKLNKGSSLTGISGTRGKSETYGATGDGNVNQNNDVSTAKSEGEDASDKSSRGNAVCDTSEIPNVAVPDPAKPDANENSESSAPSNNGNNLLEDVKGIDDLIKNIDEAKDIGDKILESIPSDPPAGNQDIPIIEEYTDIPADGESNPENGQDASKSGIETNEGDCNAKLQGSTLETEDDSISNNSEVALNADNANPNEVNDVIENPSTPNESDSSASTTQPDGSVLEIETNVGDDALSTVTSSEVPSGEEGLPTVAVEQPKDNGEDTNVSGSETVSPSGDTNVDQVKAPSTESTEFVVGSDGNLENVGADSVTDATSENDIGVTSEELIQTSKEAAESKPPAEVTPASPVESTDNLQETKENTEIGSTSTNEASKESDTATSSAAVDVEKSGQTTSGAATEEPISTVEDGVENSKGLNDNGNGDLSAGEDTTGFPIPTFFPIEWNLSDGEDLSNSNGEALSNSDASATTNSAETPAKSKNDTEAQPSDNSVLDTVVTESEATINPTNGPPPAEKTDEEINNLPIAQDIPPQESNVDTGEKNSEIADNADSDSSKAQNSWETGSTKDPQGDLPVDQGALQEASLSESIPSSTTQITDAESVNDIGNEGIETAGPDDGVQTVEAATTENNERQNEIKVEELPENDSTLTSVGGVTSEISDNNGSKEGSVKHKTSSSVEEAPLHKPKPKDPKKPVPL